MKIQTIKADVQKSQEFETINYGVSTDNLPLLFQMLRTNLYSDIHGSIIREICSNVIDSHAEAGKSDAIGEIEWVDENRLLGVDSQLIIRDFGVGLSPERMKNIYGNYLSSTKRDSNDQIGGFGLGSKVPFAYTDSFFVKTVYNGTEYKYLCYIDESQLGAISLLEKNETTRQNGTEIIVPVKDRRDKDRFQAAIFMQLAYFKKFRYINIHGPETKILFENDHCIVATGHKHNNLHIILGNVAYPVDFGVMGWNLWNSGYSNCYVGLKFTIGELQPTISRESLFWNDAVKKKVQIKMEKAKASIRKEIEKELSQEKDFSKWYTAVITKKCKNFPAQWDFSNVADKADFITQSGVTLPIKNRLDHWFAGLNLRLVTPYKAPFSRKAKISKVPEYSTSSPSIHDLADKPIYQYSGTLSARKSLFLFKTYPHGFIAVSDKGLDNIEDKKSAQPYYTEGLSWMSKLPDYDAVQVPDDEFTTTSDEDYKEAYKKILAQRKLEGKFTAKKVTINSVWGSRYQNSLTFSMYEGKFEDHKEGIVIYGTQENHNDLIKAAALLSPDNELCNHNGFNDLSVFKISQANLKHFKLMTNAYEVTEVLAGKTALNKHFGNIYTAIKVEEEIKSYELLAQFSLINKELRQTYLDVKTFCKETGQTKWWGNNILEEVEAICKAHKLSNQKMEDKLAEIKTYFDTAGLLKCIKDTSKCEKDIIEYLNFKGLKTNSSKSDLVKSE